MKICHLSSAHRPFDTRIFQKEARCLVKNGFEVVIIAQHDKAETIDGVTIIPLPRPKTRPERMTLTVLRLLRTALKTPADVYHFHDPELIWVGVVLKLMTGAAVFYDVHEDYPRLFLHKPWMKNILVRKIVSFAFRHAEKTAVRFFDRVIAVTEDIAANFPPEKTVLVRNFVSLDVIDSIAPHPTGKKLPAVINMGSLEYNRGIVEIVNAAGILDGAIELWLVGNWTSEDLRRDCEQSPGWKYTKYFGFLKPEEAFAILKTADIGLHCVYPNDFYLAGLPTKIFEYAANGIPAVMTRSRHWETLFSDFVLFADPRNPQDIAEKIKRLIDDEALRKSMGKKGRAFIECDCNWERESLALIEAYRSAAPAL